MKPCVTDGIAVAGYNQSFQRVILHAPNKYYDLNLTDMYTEQGIMHLLVVLQYGHSLDDLTGWLIRGSLETMMLELRTQENLFTQDYSKLHSLTTNSWIKMVWQFQMEHHIQIKMDLPPLSKSRVQDQFLIKSFAQAGIQGAELARINWCWIYVKVMTLADICKYTYYQTCGQAKTTKPSLWDTIGQTRDDCQKRLDTAAIGTSPSLPSG